MEYMPIDTDLVKVDKGDRCAYKEQVGYPVCARVKNKF